MTADIRLAEQKDVPAVYDIMRETTAALTRKEFFVDDDLDALYHHVEDQGFILLARIGDEAAGFLIVHFPGMGEENLGRDLGWPDEILPCCAHIDSACVRPVYRGHGLQKRLVRAAEERLPAMGMTYGLATIHPENIPSLSSMTALGYKIGATKCKYGGLLRHILFKKLS